MSDTNSQNQSNSADNDHELHDHHLTPDGVILPAGTIWPAVMALGIMFFASGIVTTWVMSVLGAIMAIIGAAYWLTAFARDVSILAPLQPGVLEAADVQPTTTKIEEKPAPGTRAMYPDKVYPISAGLKGGIIGALAMVVIALIYGALSGRGIWYPVNLLSAMVMPGYQGATAEYIAQFHIGALIVGIIIHGIMAPCIAVVLSVVYTMLPRPRWIFGGIVGPIIWTAVLYALMFALNPPLSGLMEPGAVVAFTLSQFAYAFSIIWMLERSDPIYPEHPEMEANTGAVAGN